MSPLQAGSGGGGAVPTLPTALSQLSSFPLTENHWCLQAQERGAIWAAEPQVDQVAAEVVLPVLLWERLPRPQPGLLVGGRRQPGGPETGTQHCSPHEGEGTAAGISSQGSFHVLLHSSACALSCGTANLGDVVLRPLDQECSCSSCGDLCAGQSHRKCCVLFLSTSPVRIARCPC